ncbi:hypothetical protein M422DRAFT_263351 [Sphaerobolus stellatus SS14]|uniref:Uncharacterized protein n=1 Tax=Sphaerobolus stellatus (strain SS14) TaxID=990650 RepID=A0A0C9VB90_SPHS4|nr:hypothetical protein M422DRAFT_263351 [Sphaerobolus stellatus SS14]
MSDDSYQVARNTEGDSEWDYEAIRLTIEKLNELQEANQQDILAKATQNHDAGFKVDTGDVLALKDVLFSLSMHYRDGATDVVLNSVLQDVPVMAESQHPTQASSGSSEEVSPTVVKDGFKPPEEVHNGCDFTHQETWQNATEATIPGQDVDHRQDVGHMIFCSN